MKIEILENTRYNGKHLEKGKIYEDIDQKNSEYLVYLKRAKFVKEDITSIKENLKQLVLDSNLDNKENTNKESQVKKTINKRTKESK